MLATEEPRRPVIRLCVCTPDTDTDTGHAVANQHHYTRHPIVTHSPYSLSESTSTILAIRHLPPQQTVHDDILEGANSTSEIRL